MEKTNVTCSSPAKERKITKVGQIGTLAILAGIIALWFAPALTGWLWTFAFMFGGILCSLNAKHCKRIHCTFTGPWYLIIGLISLIKTLDILTLSWWMIWGAFFAGTLVAFAPEWLQKRKYWNMQQE